MPSIPSDPLFYVIFYAIGFIVSIVILGFFTMCEDGEEWFGGIIISGFWPLSLLVIALYFIIRGFLLTFYNFGRFLRSKFKEMK